MFVLTLWDLSTAVYVRRDELGLTQAELAERVGVSRKWIQEFEARKPRAELHLVLRLLDELGLVIDVCDLRAMTPAPRPDPDIIRFERGLLGKRSNR